MQNLKTHVLRMLSELRADLERLVQLHESHHEAVQNLLAPPGHGPVGFCSPGDDQFGGRPPAGKPDLPAEPGKSPVGFHAGFQQAMQQMQQAHQQFTRHSSIMKTKHDTVKNSIRNMQ